MTNKEEELIGLLMRKYNALRTDFMLLMGIAHRSQQDGVPVHDLFGQLEALRQLPYHVEMRQLTEQLLTQFRHSIDEDALIQWIEEQPKDKLPN